MTSLPRLRVALIAILFMALSACGGGAGSEGGIGGSGIASGVMQDQNQPSRTAQVNGVTFDTSNTLYSEEGSNASAANIQPGMVVVVQGTIDTNGATGTANSIAYADLLEGPISDITATTITAMGQTILVDDGTIYSGAGVSDLADLKDGDVIEVSGFFTAEGDIYATYVERTDSTAHEIKGVISAVTPGTSFNIGALLVNWANTSGLNVNDFVKAEGMMNGATTLNATSVSARSPNFELANADDAEIEGLVTSACSPATPPCTFLLGFITVQVNSTTEFEGGLLANIQPGVRIEVEGSLNNNIVIAEEIEFKDVVEIISDVSAVGVNTFDLEYGATDVTVTYDPNITKLDSIANFAAIKAGDHLKVRARKSGSQVVAIRIEDSRGNTDLALQGQVEAALNPNLTVLGVTLNTNNLGADVKFKDQNGVTISQDQFFAMANSSNLARLKGTITNGNVISWKEIKLEK